MRCSPRAKSTAPTASGSTSARAARASSKSSSAIACGIDEVKALPDGLRYREAMNLFSPAAYVRERFEICGTGRRRVVRMLVEREGVRGRVACARGGPVRRGDRRRRRDAVPDDALRVRVARAAVAIAVPALRCGTRRHLARRSGGLRAADARTGARAGRAARLWRERGRASSVDAASGRRRRGDRDARRASRWRSSAAPTSTT